MSLQDRTTLRSTYLYLVCLVTLIMSIFAAVSVVRNVAQLAFPDPGYYSEPAFGPEGKVIEEDPAARERREQQALDSQRRNAVLGIVSGGAMLLIAGPAYLYHWRRVQSEHAPARPEGPADDRVGAVPR